MKRSLVRIIALSLITVLLTGCTVQEKIPASYFIIDNGNTYQDEIPTVPDVTVSYASDYAVIPKESAGTRSFGARLCINNTTNEVICNESPFESIYPASITKIMTALLVLERGKLSDTVTVTEEINLNDPMAVKLGLKVGDTLTVDTLMHGMLITSANDCAVILARYVSGNEAAFVEAMNQRAWELGATHTHFTNPHGLHNADHYTTAYDLYLIFRELIKHPEFRQIAELPAYTVQYTDGGGNPVEVSIRSSNGYISGAYEEPEGVTVLAGKTGTTNEAGKCLILLASDEKGQEYILVLCGASGQDSLYYQMQEMLETIPFLPLEASSLENAKTTSSCCTSLMNVL